MSGIALTTVYRMERGAHVPRETTVRAFATAIGSEFADFSEFLKSDADPAAPAESVSNFGGVAKL